MNVMFAGVLRGVLRPAQGADKRPPRKKPFGLVYAVDDVPPPLVTLLNAVQHGGVIAINLVYPVLIFRAVDTPGEVVSSLLTIEEVIARLDRCPCACPVSHSIPWPCSSRGWR